jgi:peptidylprolyl isomerase
VVQWADPNTEDPAKKRKLTHAKATLPAEFERAIENNIPFTPLKDLDVYAKEVGFTDGFAVARDKDLKKTWMLHCYGAVGAGRDESIDSGGGTELYAVIGHAPRHLDRNVTLLGRVIQGIDLLSTLPRGPAPMGFYADPNLQVQIKSIRVAADVPPNERIHLEIMRTDTPSFEKLMESRRRRPESWFHVQAKHVDICNVPIPVRAIKKN